MAVFTINSEAAPLLRVLGGYGVKSPEEVCEIAFKNNDFIGYIPEGTTLGDTPIIYEDSSGTIGAPTGWYSNGVISRYWVNDFGIFKETKTCS